MILQYSRVMYFSLNKIKDKINEYFNNINVSLNYLFF